ncbi:MAG: ABC-F family ATP-binding cassette domain-containing protein [Spirochaetaceae bacterium]|nr:ABC-F family ATP-binding cassette domain-containing protein [Spirochaetaceae bacterium]
MGTLQVQDISLAFGDRDILSNINFTLYEKSRVALVGGNGSGKSTLLKIICNIIPSDSMNVSQTKGIRVSYLPQSDIVFEEATLYNEVEKGYFRFNEMLIRKKELEELLSHIDESDKIDSELLELHNIQEDLLLSGYFDRKIKIEQILKGLGFHHEDLTRHCSEFSGGWQMRVALAKILVENPDIMFLDEPTNYLDIEARVWLRNYLKVYSGGLMLVSHDQDFLDQTVNEVYELFKGGLTKYAGNYTQYIIQREIEIEQKEKEGKSQAEQIAKTEVFIEKFRYKASKSKQVQSRIKQLEKVEIIEVPSHLKKMHFQFPTAPHSGNDVMKIVKLSKNFGEHQIFKNLNFHVNKGDRLAVTGANGEGKSTLLRILCRQDNDYTGQIIDGVGLKIGYFAQDTEKTLNQANDLMGEISQVTQTCDLPNIRNYLGAFLFQGDDVFKSISVLSGGERSRIALLKILMNPVNLLILDEPTNHLDINSKDMLIEALKGYDGTMIFVSHDSYFIEHLATRILYLSEEKPEFFEGGYSYFKTRLEEKEKIESNNIETVENVEVSTGALSYKAQREKNNRLNKLQRENEKLLIENDKLTEKISELEIEMSKSEVYSDATKITKVMSDKEKLELKMEENEELWLEVEEEITQLSSELKI